MECINEFPWERVVFVWEKKERLMDIPAIMLKTWRWLSSQLARRSHFAQPRQTPGDSDSQHSWQVGQPGRAHAVDTLARLSHSKRNENRIDDGVLPPSSPYRSLFPPKALQSPVTNIVWSPNGTYIACLTEKEIQVWHSFTGEHVSTGGIPYSKLLWSPDGTRYALEWGPALLGTWNALTGEQLSSYTQHIDGVHSIVSDVAWSTDGMRLACIGTAISLRSHTGTADDISIHGTKNNHIWVWEAATGQTITCYQGYSYRTGTSSAMDDPGLPKVLVWSPLGNQIASLAYTAQKALRIWDATTGEELTRAGLPSGSGGALSWSPDASLLATTLGKTVSLWEVTPDFQLPDEARIYTGHQANVSQFSWPPASSFTNNSVIASADDDHSIHVWNTTTGKAVTIYHGHSKERKAERSLQLAMAWSPDGRYIASSLRASRFDVSGKSYSIHLWEAASGKLVAIYDGSSWGWTPHGLSIAAVAERTVVTIGQAMSF
jgi:WD40 repeat protein